MFYNPCKYGTVRHLWLPAVSTFCTRKCLAGRQTGKFVVVEVCPKTGSRVVAVALASLVRHGYLVASKIEVARFRFIRIAIPVPWDILEELEPESESKE